VGTAQPRTEKGAGVEKQARDRGCITSTPKSGDFSKKHEKRAKNERGFCIPRPKNAERPYLAS